MRITSEYALFCKLGGFIGSNPEIVSSFPSLVGFEEKSDVLNTCFPIGIKVGDFHEDRYKKYSVLSYIFKIPQLTDRDDLFSISVLLHKRENVETYKPALQELINLLDTNGLLNEEILKNYNQRIYEGLNEEKDIYIENLLIDFSKFFEEIKTQKSKAKPDIKGSFF
ncbi:MAG: hypothetical protein ACFFCI_05740 [Promethearchaeota archaeon]